MQTIARPRVAMSAEKDAEDLKIFAITLSPAIITNADM